MIDILTVHKCQTKPEYNFLILGPKMAEENKRGFTEQQLKEGSNVIGWLIENIIVDFYNKINL